MESNESSTLQRHPPHFGGVFEAMIKTAKRALRSILGKADVYNEESHTAICSTASQLNSRPITYISTDDNYFYVN